MRGCVVCIGPFGKIECLLHTTTSEHVPISLHVGVGDGVSTVVTSITSISINYEKPSMFHVFRTFLVYHLHSRRRQ